MSDTGGLYWCAWNWCREVFACGQDLVQHLESTHFSSLLVINEGEWDTYMPPTEGVSGLTDSFLPLEESTAAIPANERWTYQENAQLHGLSSDLHTPSPPPSLPTSPSPPGLRPLNPLSPQDNEDFELSSMPSTSTQPERSFANFTAQSSPMQTPDVAAIPPSPQLSNMVADAINAASRANARPQPRTHKQMRNGHEHARSSDSSATSTGSSAGNVETQLTADMNVSPSPQSRTWLRTRLQSESQSQRQEGYPKIDMHTQVAYASQRTVHKEIQSFFTQYPPNSLDYDTPPPSFRSGTLRVRSSDSSQQSAAYDAEPEGSGEAHPDGSLQGSSSGVPSPALYGYRGYGTELQTQAPYYSQSQSQ